MMITGYCIAKLFYYHGLILFNVVININDYNVLIKKNTSIKRRKKLFVYLFMVVILRFLYLEHALKTTTFYNKGGGERLIRNAIFGL